MENIIALLANLSIVGLEVYVLGHIKGKKNILKYYTYLQNLIALIASAFLSAALLLGGEIPEFIKGLRYIATCGLLAAMFIFVAFLGAGKKASMTAQDFLPGCGPKTANRILHYLCPVLSLLSFVFFERQIALSNGLWTSIAPIPSCLYWVTYLILSGMHAWKEPYDLSAPGEKNKLLEILYILLIPFSFILISFLLWKVK